jgi:drug/metabolite transporter (DMT)-like permease
MPYLILLFGVFCCSTSVIFIKIGTTDPVALSAYRLLLGAAFIALLAHWQRPAHLPRPDWFSLLKKGMIPGVLLGVHFISWIIGARMTPSANASLIVNMVPVVMPLLLFVVVSETLNRWEWMGTACAMAGVAFLGISDFNFSREYAMGDAICFLSMLLYAGYLVYARKHRDLPSIYDYVIPVYLVGGVFCLIAVILMQLGGYTVLWIGPSLPREALSIIGLALIPTVLGHSIINWALSRLRGQTVVVINLAQFVFAGIMGFLLLSETPQLSFYVASLLVVGGALLAVLMEDPAGVSPTKPSKAK